jgi:hypothetical protein
VKELRELIENRHKSPVAQEILMERISGILGGKRIGKD